MAFNFGSLADVRPANTTSYLKPYSINENVAIKSSEIKQGTSEKGNSWKCLQITFGNNEGIYTDSIFWINPENPADVNRTKVTMSNGGEREMPSNWERARDKMAAIGYAFFPTSFEKMKAISGKFKSFDDVMEAFKKILDASIDKKTTKMKLVGRNVNGHVYATLPNCTGIAQANEKTAASNNVQPGEYYTWMISPFGDDLYFSTYEESQRAKFVNAKPTNMSEEINSETTDSNEDFDLESLL